MHNTPRHTLTKPLARPIMLAAASLTLAFSSACGETVEFTTPGRAPPVAGDLVIEVDGVPRGFGKPRLTKDGSYRPIIFAEIGETATEALIRIPEKASTVSCAETPKAIVLTTSSPLEHANTAYYPMDWVASECSITVSRIDAAGAQGAEGSFSATLVRAGDEVGGKTVEGPKTIVVKGTFIASARR
ncbi:MAG: hypothetical protein IPF92_07285 [Myxococcales bacterium]|nr:hypothetical protein [Myxococcales bacterium]MBL0197415.1 hypothetical protein [Myxococcales bacterium]